jgi:uncharacterized secreted protein with C-terminal beta-propeller domain
MSGTYPSSPEFTSVDFRVNTPTQTTETVNGRKRRAGFGTSFYTFDGKYSMLTPSQVAPIQAFIAKQYGQLESFQIVLPKISYNKAADYAQAVGNAKVKTAASKGAFSVALKGLGNNKAIFKAGDYFKFANHSKVYMVTDDVTSNGSGEATLYFSGKLVANVVVDEVLTINAVPFTVILDQEADEWSIGVGGMTSIEVSFREVW